MTEPNISPEFLSLQSAVAGRYSLVRELGRGGMGVVFLAREVSLDRLVAIKLLPPRMSGEASVRERFLREARTAARLSHPHIVSIHAVETSGDCVFFVMEYVEGISLGHRLRASGALGHDATLRIARETVWALTHAHSRGVIHRDIKPDNILIDEASGRAVVTDFGIAREGDGHDSAAGHGTLHYMSPEQALGEPADARADIYSLGVTLYHTVSGRRPFDGLEGGALLAAQAGADVPSVRVVAPEITPALAEVIDRAIHRDPVRRFADAEEMAAALQSVHTVTHPLPMALTRFARHSVEHGGRLGEVLGAAGSATVGALMIDAFFENSFFGLEQLPFLVVASLGFGLSLFLMVLHGRAIREVASLGYSREAALRAIHQVEAEVEVAPPKSGLFSNPTAVAMLGSWATLLGIWLAPRAGNLVGHVAALLVTLVVPVITVRRVAALRGAKGSWWSRLLKGRLGRGLWKVATLGLGSTTNAPVAGEPTALAVGQLVQQLWRALPASEQQLLAEVPDLAERLEGLALARESPLATEAMAALETLRLDLMRLRAGQLHRESITDDLRKLREFGMYVDARDETE